MKRHAEGLLWLAWFGFLFADVLSSESPYQPLLAIVWAATTLIAVPLHFLKAWRKLRAAPNKAGYAAWVVFQALCALGLIGGLVWLSVSDPHNPARSRERALQSNISLMRSTLEQSLRRPPQATAIARRAGRSRVSQRDSNRPDDQTQRLLGFGVVERPGSPWHRRHPQRFPIRKQPGNQILRLVTPRNRGRISFKLPTPSAYAYSINSELSFLLSTPLTAPPPASAPPENKAPPPPAPAHSRPTQSEP